MKHKLHKLVTPCLLMGAVLLPAASHAAQPDEQSAGSSAAGSYVKDSLITAKIKAAFARDPQVSVLNIKVETDENGVVLLSGKARSKAESERAQAIALHTTGVSLVENRIEAGQETGSRTPAMNGKFADDVKKPGGDGQEARNGK